MPAILISMLHNPLTHPISIKKTNESNATRTQRSKVAPHCFLESWTTFQVPVKCVRNVQDALDVFHAERLLIVDSQGLSGADCVFDLQV
jgi:hypothetical protein